MLNDKEKQLLQDVIDCFDNTGGGLALTKSQYNRYWALSKKTDLIYTLNWANTYSVKLREEFREAVNL